MPAERWQARPRAASSCARYATSAAAEVPARLDDALKLANAAIGQCVEENPALDGMGCTLIGTVFGPAGVEWVSVGDSPLFLLRHGEIVLLNEDHSLAPEIDKLAAAGTHELGGRQGRSAPALPALGADRRRHGADRPLAPAAAAGAGRRRDPRQRRHPHPEPSRHPARSCRRTWPRGCEAIADALLAAVEAAGDIYQDNTTVVVIRVTEAVAAT